MILVSDDTIMFGTTANSAFIILRYAFAIGLFFYFFERFLRLKKKGDGLPYLCVMMALVMATGFYFGDLRSGYFYKLILLATGYLYASLFTINGFLSNYVKITYFLALCALAGWVMMEFLPGLVSIFPVVNNVSDISFYNLLFTNVPLPVHGNRLFGLFREPGVTQVYMNLALIFLVVESNISLDYKKFVVIAAALLLTQSTTGYISLVFVLLFFLFKKGKGSKFRKEKTILSLVIMAAIIVIAATTTILSSEGDIFGKIGNTDRSSTVARLASLYSNIEIIKMYPIFGAGFDNMGTLFTSISGRLLGVDVEDNTNMLLIQFATHGIVYGLLWLIGCLKFFHKLDRHFVPYMCLVLAFLCLCVGEDLTWSFLIYILLFYGVTNAKLITYERETDN